MQSAALITASMDRQERRSALNEIMGRVLNRLFGCWLHELSRPFSNNGRTYRICVKCGMSRDFDPASWKTHGQYQMTGPNDIYSKPSARHPVLNSKVIHANSTTNREPNSPMAPRPTNLHQRVNSIGSLKQGPVGPYCNARLAA